MRSCRDPADGARLPAEFVRRTRDVFGADGDAWLRDLPMLIAGCARRWRLRLGRHFPPSYSYVVAARRRDGTEAVLKLSVPHSDLTREVHALCVYDGRGTCRLLEADEAQGALLLERLRPGTSLVELARVDDEQATRVAARLMRSLWRPAPSDESFRSLRDWFRAFERYRTRHRGPGPFSTAVFDRAEHSAAKLLATTPRSVLLHGDLHHANILSATRAPWLAIDPKGVVGDPAYEVGPFLRNPRPMPASVASRRLDIFAAELHQDRGRLREWGVAHAVLSACWSLEDYGAGWEDAIATAELLLDL